MSFISLRPLSPAISEVSRGVSKIFKGKTGRKIYGLSFRAFFSLAKKHDPYQCIFSFPAPAKT